MTSDRNIEGSAFLNLLEGIDVSIDYILKDKYIVFRHTFEFIFY